MSNSNNSNKFKNFALNENLGFLNFANSNQKQNLIINNINNKRGINFQDQLNNQPKNTGLISVSDNSEQAHQSNLRFSFNTHHGNSANKPIIKLNNEADAATNFNNLNNFNKENAYEKIDISSDNINLNGEQTNALKNKLFDSEEKSRSEFLFDKGNFLY